MQGRLHGGVHVSIVVCMKVMIACGGTGGHLYPGAATGRVLLGRGHDVTLCLTGREAESGIRNAWDGALVRLPAMAPGGGLLTRIMRIPSFLHSLGKARAALRDLSPDVVISMGSYAGVAPVLAARLAGIPVVLHEANARAGKANQMLARVAKAVCISFESVRGDFGSACIVKTGYPLRSFNTVETRTNAARSAGERFNLLVMGGSQGALALNEVVPDAVCRALSGRPEVSVTHLTGRGKTGDVKAAYDRGGVSANVMEYSDKIETLYSVSNLVIARAGAGTCSELALFGIPAILVPHPTAGRGHQVDNARELERLGGVICFEQRDLTAETLGEKLVTFLDAPAQLRQMGESIRLCAVPNASERFADVIERAVHDRRRGG